MPSLKPADNLIKQQGATSTRLPLISTDQKKTASAHHQILCCWWEENSESPVCTNLTGQKEAAINSEDSTFMSIMYDQWQTVRIPEDAQGQGVAVLETRSPQTKGTSSDALGACISLENVKSLFARLSADPRLLELCRSLNK